MTDVQTDRLAVAKDAIEHLTLAEIGQLVDVVYAAIDKLEAQYTDMLRQTIKAQVAQSDAHAGAEWSGLR
jgi:hypothetical protein